MAFRMILWTLVSVFLLSAPVAAKDAKWFEVSSDHFLLFTDTSEAKGRRLVSDFENRVTAFSQAFGKVPPRQFPIAILLFNEEQDFVEMLPRVQGPQAEKQLSKAAYLLRGPDRIFIVAKDKSPEDVANDVGHALGHVLFERFGMWRPFWLAEGTAEYVRKIGRSADTKSISEQEGFSASDMFTIVPSATYNDNDPPTAFRTEAYRLVRFVLEQKPDVLRQYLKSLGPSDKLPKIAIDGDAIEAQFKTYAETPLKPLAVTAAVRSVEADAGKLAVHRGDLLLAADRQTEAARWYNADSKEARAARAIAVRFTRPQAEALRVLDRASRELPESGLVQYHFGAMEAPNGKDLAAQVLALERATQLLPLMGRAFAELARVYALTGQAEKSLPLVSKAIELEPEYADRFYEIRADVYVALGQSSEALRAINIASDLPHSDRSAVERYNLKISAVRKRIEAARREVDSQELEALRREVRAEAEQREPPPKPVPPPPPAPAGGISYEIETRAAIEVVDAVYPDYPEDLRRKGVAGTITLQLDIGPDGKVKSASILNSQLQDLNKATLDAAKMWSFKPGNRSIRLIMRFALQ
jgi:TonB family protein